MAIRAPIPRRLAEENARQSTNYEGRTTERVSDLFRAILTLPALLKYFFPEDDDDDGGGGDLECFLKSSSLFRIPSDLVGLLTLEDGSSVRRSSWSGPASKTQPAKPVIISS